MTHPLRRVAVLSPQPIVAEGLRSILAALTDRIEVVPFGPDGPEPDVVLYDAIALQHGDQSDLDALVNKTSSAVIIVSRDLRPGLAAQALTAGADGHISIGATPAEVLDAVASTATGWLQGDEGENPTVGNIDSPTGRALSGRSASLSTRELQIITLIADGLTNRQVGETLYLTVNSVKTFIRSAYAKIGVTSRSQATAWAIAHGHTTSARPKPPVQPAPDP